MPPNFGERVLFGNDRSSRSRVRTRLITKTSTTSERVTHLHILVPAITRGTLARTHELKRRTRKRKYSLHVIPPKRVGIPEARVGDWREKLYRACLLPTDAGKLVKTTG